jgi:hypothetical protein
VSDIRIHVRTRVDGDERRSAWRTYAEAFEPLKAVAIQRAVMTPAEFDELMDDERVTKYLAMDSAGTVKGLGTMTSQIEAMTLVSPDFFAARWPEHWAAGRCYYIGIVAAAPDRQGTALFSELIQLMSYTASLTGGVAVLDVCRRNAELHGLPQAIARICSTVVPGVGIELVDTQEYWAYTSPVPTKELPRLIDLRDGTVQLPAGATIDGDAAARRGASGRALVGVSTGPATGRPNSQP